MSSTTTTTKQVFRLRWPWIWLLPFACASSSLFFLLIRPFPPLQQPHLHEPLCLSRTHLPLKPFPHIPPALHHEWELYVDMHRRCTTNFTSHALTNPPDPEESQFSCKFLIYIDGVEGLGNRFLSLASAWVYSLLTHRVLLIDTRRDMPKLLCEPFPGSTWLLPDDFSYDSALSSWPSLGSILSSSASPPNSVTVSFQRYGPALQIYLRHDQGYGDCQLFCDHIQEPLKQVRSLSWVSNLYLLPHLHLVPSFWQKMAALFPSPQNTFALVSRLLLHPSNEVWRLVLDDYSAHLSHSKTKVGLQIRLVRIGGSPAAFTESALQGILQCLIENSFLPNTTTDAYGDGGGQSHEGLASRNRNTAVDVGLQVVSLQRQYAERLASLYSKSGDGGERVRVHTMCSLENQDMSFEQAKLAYAEMILLSLTDKLATSASSTFGYMAQSWGNLPSLILDFGELNDGREATNTCKKRAESIDPCTHDPLVPPCLQPISSGDKQPHPMIMNSSYLSSDHRKWLTAHLHFCQDRPGAWQLVDARDAHLYPPVFLYHATE